LKYKKLTFQDLTPSVCVPDRKFTVIDGMVSHSWYLEDSVWYDDLALTLKGQIDRDSIPARTKVGKNDFVLMTNGK